MSMQESVNEMINLLPLNTEFTGKEFDTMFKRKYPEYKYKMDGTIMRRLRDCKNKYGSRKVICINAERSLYKKVQA